MLGIRTKIKDVLQKKYTKSFSQMGEDLVVAFLLKNLEIKNPFYLDIGANDPIAFSNTYQFYLNGGSGICVEPNPTLVRSHKSKRSKDTIIQAGISHEETTLADYYVMNWHEFNTFDKTQAEQVEKNYEGRNDILSVEKIKLISVDNLLEQHVKNNAIDFLSLDVEGFDLKILQAWDFINHAPKIICVEIYDPKLKEKNNEIHELLIDKNYKMAAQNPINGIYVLDGL